MMKHTTNDNFILRALTLMLVFALPKENVPADRPSEKLLIG